MLLSLPVEAQNPFWTKPTGPATTDISALHVRPNGEIFIGSNQKLYSSSDTGVTWVYRQGGVLADGYICAVSETKNGTLFASVSLKGMFRSTDNGRLWVYSEKGLASQYFSFIDMLSDTANSLYAAGYEGLFRTTDDGQNWKTVYVDATRLYPEFHCIAMNSKKIIFTSCKEGLFRSTDNGVFWKKIHVGLTDTAVNRVAVLENDVMIASTDSGRLFISRNDGSAWQRLPDLNCPGTNMVYKFPSRNELFLYNSTKRLLFYSIDTALTWSAVDTIPFASDVSQIRSLPSGRLLLGMVRNNVFIYSRPFTALQPCGTAGMTASNTFSLVSSPKGYLFAGTEKDGIFRSVDQGNTWQQVSYLYSGQLHALKCDTSGSIFAGSNINFGVIRSTDNGTTWSNSTNGLLSPYINALAITSNNDIFAGTVTYGVYRSKDKGITWNMIYNNFTSTMVNALTVDSKDVVYAAADNGVYSLPSGSTTWNTVNTSSLKNQSSLVCDSHDHIFIGGPSRTVSRSTDKGASWTVSTVSQSGTAINSIVASSNNQLYATLLGGGVFRSVDHGSTWENINDGVISVYAYSLEISNDGYLFAATGSGIAKSALPVDPLFTVSDSSLTIAKTKLNDTSNVSFTVKNVSRFKTLRIQFTHSDRYFATAPSDTIFLNPLSQQVVTVRFVPKSVGIFVDTLLMNREGAHILLPIMATSSLTDIHQRQSTTLPLVFSLEQNYPNPFNPNTTISFSIPERSYVTLKVYDMLGRNIVTLISEERSAGFYDVPFNARRFASGIYCYSIQAGQFHEVKKMLLVK